MRTSRMSDAADSLKAKLDAAQGRTPEDDAKMDADIRSNKRSVEARQIVAQVQAARRRGRTPEQISADPSFAAAKVEFPRLFKMLLDPRHSEAMLSSMLRQLEAVEAGARTTHEASVTVGTILVNQFVRPKLGMEPVPLPGSGK
jgi:hypothetical protein